MPSAEDLQGGYDPHHHRASAASQRHHAWAPAAVQRRHPCLTPAGRSDLCVGGHMPAAVAPLCTPPTAARCDAAAGVRDEQPARPPRCLALATNEDRPSSHATPPASHTSVHADRRVHDPRRALPICGTNLAKILDSVPSASCTLARRLPNETIPTLHHLWGDRRPRAAASAVPR